MSFNWYSLDLTGVDTPALIINKDLVQKNILRAIEIAGSLDRLRPHVKTHKSLEIARMQNAEGISKFKCATIAEAEMLGIAKAKDVLLAYPVQGPKIQRLIRLIKAYRETNFSFLVDNIKTVQEINREFESAQLVASVCIDVNNGQNRTGIPTYKAFDLIKSMKGLNSINLKGIHCYDGHIRMTSMVERTREIQIAFKEVQELHKKSEGLLNKKLILVAGGSPSFPVHAAYHEVECSPGTWIFWDQRYGDDYPEQAFHKAGVLATRIISQIDSYTYCTDLGHKSVASESPFPRVHFISDEIIEQIGHSEEHLIIRTKEENVFEPGQILLAYPYHICPTVALYSNFHVVQEGKIVDQWEVTARNRSIGI